jgi:hypothetical protein
MLLPYFHRRRFRNRHAVGYSAHYRVLSHCRHACHGNSGNRVGDSFSRSVCLSERPLLSQLMPHSLQRVCLGPSHPTKTPSLCLPLHRPYFLRSLRFLLVQSYPPGPHFRWFTPLPRSSFKLQTSNFQPSNRRSHNLSTRPRVRPSQRKESFPSVFQDFCVGSSVFSACSCSITLPYFAWRCIPWFIRRSFSVLLIRLVWNGAFTGVTHNL